MSIRQKKRISSVKKTKEYHLREYLKLTVSGNDSKATVARYIMDIVEEINENGMNDQRYLTIMNKLMELYKEDKISNDDMYPPNPDYGTRGLGHYGEWRYDVN